MVAVMAHRVAADYVLAGVLILFVLAICFAVAMSELDRLRALRGPSASTRPPLPLSPRGESVRAAAGRGVDGPPSARLEVSRLDRGGRAHPQLWAIDDPQGRRLGQAGWSRGRGYVFEPGRALELDPGELRQIAALLSRLNHEQAVWRDRRRARTARGGRA